MNAAFDPLNFEIFLWKDYKSMLHALRFSKLPSRKGSALLMLPICRLQGKPSIKENNVSSLVQNEYIKRTKL